MKIIAFTFAGGNKYSFNNFFQKELNIIVLEYAGRGTRMTEPLLTRMDDVIADLYPKVKKEILIGEPYIIYGHSMGSLVAYQVCKKIQREGLPLPIKLIINGAKGPQYSKEKIISNLPDNEFWKEITKLGGVPEEIVNETELVNFFIPILKADYKCVEDYHFDEESPTIKIPIDVFYGSEEDITKIEVTGWKEVSSKNVNITQLRGNHFFFFEHKEYFTKYIQQQVSYNYE
ncbi:thioesterase II family protein [Snuella sedimenti]|uniref:Thioesterase n=1 Tax=Snuella sedimenti TaxID=2798802 RepID=A0A8J7IYN2_9FLAO|nr:thioesterase [Snuella sedimenti]MBJ6369820.1 thioesterase [Snuella sedimenti]